MGHLEKTDEDLVHALVDGDTVAFKDIYTKYWKKLYVIARNRVNDTTIAEELLQDVFMDLWERRERLVIYTSLQSYIICALKYRIFNHFRKEALRRRHSDEVKYLHNEADMTTINQLTFDELYQQLHNSVDSLPPQCKVIFKMSRFDKMSSKEIAGVLNISPKTVDNQINKALKILRSSTNDLSPEVS